MFIDRLNRNAGVGVYYPFGMVMPGRSYTQEIQYRCGFQNQETDPELWDGSVSYRYRIEDPRLGRFFSVDPLASKYSHNSPYAFSENKVISFVELEGLEAAPPSAPSDSQILWQNPNVVTTLDNTQNVGSNQISPVPNIPAPLDLSTLNANQPSMTQQQMATQVMNHFLRVFEAMQSDPMSPLNQNLGIPVNQIFSNVARSQFDLNTPTQAVMDAPGVSGQAGLPVTFSLNIVQTPNEAILPNINTFVNGSGVINPDGTQVPLNPDGTLNPNASDYSITVPTNGGGLISIKASDTQLSCPNAQYLESQFFSRLNHAFILRDKLVIWNERQATNSGLGDLFPTIPLNARSLQIIAPIGFRANNIPGMNPRWPALIRSDGDFRR